MTSSPEVRLALILMRTLDDMKDDPKKIRNAVFSLARLKLGEELQEHNPEEASRIMSALETAIDGVEQFSTDEDNLAPLLPASNPAAPAEQPHLPDFSFRSTASGPKAPRRSDEEIRQSTQTPQETDDAQDAATVADRQTSRAEAPSADAREWAAAGHDPEPVKQPNVERDDPIFAVEDSAPTHEDNRRDNWELSENNDDGPPPRDTYWSTDNDTSADEQYAPSESDTNSRPLVIIEPRPLPPLHYSHNPTYTFPPSAEPNQKWLTPTLIGVVVVLVGIVGFFAGRQMLQSQLSASLAPPSKVAATASHTPATAPNGVPQNPSLANEAAPDAPAAAAEETNPNHLPLPTVYGIFALGDGKLTALTPLVGRVPDARVAISGAIVKPSAVTLPTGKLQFVLYRRDLASLAVDHLDVRVIAKVVQSMSFDSGKVAIAKEDDTWAIRNISYAFNVAPVPGKPDMLLLRPQNEDFVFPAGRFGLVVNSLAYDFSVAGEIIDTNQCLQLVKAVNGSFYSACQQKEVKGPNEADKKEKRAGGNPPKR